MNVLFVASLGACLETTCVREIVLGSESDVNGNSGGPSMVPQGGRGRGRGGIIPLLCAAKYMPDRALGNKQTLLKLEGMSPHMCFSLYANIESLWNKHFSGSHSRPVAILLLSETEEQDQDTRYIVRIVAQIV